MTSSAFNDGVTLSVPTPVHQTFFPATCRQSRRYQTPRVTISARRQVTRQRGFTLIEMVAVIAMTGLVMTSVAVTISSLHRLNTKLRDELFRSTAVTTLSLSLRSDAHSAVNATIAVGDPQRPTLRLSLPDQRVVEYTADEDRVIRVVRSGEKEERHEVFQLHAGGRATWSIGDTAVPLITMRIQRRVGKASGAAGSQREITVMAAVGLDHAERLK
jgi:prepilin-type N-terminal cleavage/methylation domain-containing protein